MDAQLELDVGFAESESPVYNENAPGLIELREDSVTVSAGSETEV